jgi:hypothetical protein
METGVRTAKWRLSCRSEFGNIAARLNKDLPYQPWAAQLVKERAAGVGKDDPVAACQPAGAIRLFTYPPYRKIVQNPGLVVILSERDVTFRQIFTDGRPLPKDPNPSFNGYSVGDGKATVWTVKLHQILLPDSDLLEYYCQENEKDAQHIFGK